jgi:hypothetical protein
MISLKIFKTQIHIHPAVFLLVVAIWAGATWLNLYLFPSRGFWQTLLIGFATMILLILADFGHAFAHIFSARLAGAPMDEVRITITQMPHTLYKNNSVSPNVHRMRAMGGPLFNAVCLLLSAVAFYLAPTGWVVHELAGWSAAAHSMMLIMSLAPLPIVDGGTLIKWTLVKKGWSESLAEKTALQTGWTVGIVATLLGLLLITLHIWIIGGIFLAAGIIVLGIAVGIVR